VSIRECDNHTSMGAVADGTVHAGLMHAVSAFL
jgi:hypothetical protein